MLMTRAGLLFCLLVFSHCQPGLCADGNHTDEAHQDHGEHHHDEHHHDEHEEHDVHDRSDLHADHISPTDTKIWLAATGAILVISLCGIFGILVIPIMQKVFYQHLIQFLIALAVGTLAGDALLHLLPHALLSVVEQGEGHSHGGGHDMHQSAVWLGFVAVSALISFFLFEKLVNILGEWRERVTAAKGNRAKQPRVVREGHVASDMAIGERVCKHKYSAYCATDFDLENVNKKEDTFKCMDEEKAAEEENDSPGSVVRNISDCVDPSSAGSLLPSVSDSVLSVGYNGKPGKDRETVIISQHEHVHHGHSHAHSHLHSAPSSISSVAWMVIFGDGIHNLADGLAIGAAFAEGLMSGFSTSLAVLCHELPHEIGDFAMLLKAGMSVKQAVFYNILSSVLAFIGMVAGFLLGTLDNFAPWMFSATAGVFLYVALVDMMPELSSGHSHPLSQHKQHESPAMILLQIIGMSTGAVIMLLIALYEHDLKRAFEPN